MKLYWLPVDAVLTWTVMNGGEIKLTCGDFERTFLGSENVPPAGTVWTTSGMIQRPQQAVNEYNRLNPKP